MSSMPDIFGLVLAGGMSSRMGRDKGRIVYKDGPEAVRVYELLRSCGMPAYISLREGQWSEDEVRGLPIIHDAYQGLGPIGGILSAWERFPNSACLLIGCDLPLLTQDSIQHLLSQRQRQKLATAYRGYQDLPEPLCAIYEAGMRERLIEAIEKGVRCPRKVLLQSDCYVIEASDPMELTNVNTVEDYEALQRRISRRISVRYFAALKERSGKDREEIETKALTALDLYRELQSRHGFILDEKHLQLAINREYRPLNSTFHSGDELVFIPPVAGG